MNAIKMEPIVIVQPTPPVHMQRHLHPICPNLCVRHVVMLFGEMAPVTVVGIQAVYLTLQKRKQKSVRRRVPVVDMNAIKMEPIVIFQPTPPVHR